MTHRKRGMITVILYMRFIMLSKSTIEHLFVNCRGNFNQRRWLGLVKPDGSPQEPKETLGKNVEIERIRLFLKEVRVFELI